MSTETFAKMKKEDLVEYRYNERTGDYRITAWLPRMNERRPNKNNFPKRCFNFICRYVQ